MVDDSKNAELEAVFQAALGRVEVAVEAGGSEKVGSRRAKLIIAEVQGNEALGPMFRDHAREASGTALEAEAAVEKKVLGNLMSDAVLSRGLDDISESSQVEREGRMAKIRAAVAAKASEPSQEP